MVFGAVIKIAGAGGGGAGTAGAGATLVELSKSSAKSIGSEVKGAFSAALGIVVKPMLDILTAIFGILLIRVVKHLAGIFEVLGDMGRILVDIGKIFFNVLTGNFKEAGIAFQDLLADSKELVKDLVDLVVEPYAKMKEAIIEEATKTQKEADRIYNQMKENTLDQVGAMANGMVDIWNAALAQLKLSSLGKKVARRAGSFAGTSALKDPEQAAEAEERAEETFEKIIRGRLGEGVISSSNNQKSGTTNNITFNGMVPEQVIEFVSKTLGKSGFIQGRF